MDRGKERAGLRSAGLRRLMLELENKRDRLLDEVAHKQGEAEAAEQTIRRIHEMILDINKEEQSAVDLENAIREREKEEKEAKKKNAPRKKKVEKTLDGKKNSTKAKETVERAKRARATARKKKEKKED